MRRLSKCLIIGACLLATYGLAFTGVYFVWNDESMGRSVSGWVSKPMRGAGGPTKQSFVLDRVHYPYWCTMSSLIFSNACLIEVRGVHIYDAAGAVVIEAPLVYTHFDVGRVVWSQFFALFGPQRTKLRFRDAQVMGARANIALTATGEVNIIQSFSFKHPSPSKGGVVIDVGFADLRDIDFSIALNGWSAHVPQLQGQGNLRFSSLPEDNHDPQHPAFSYSVSPMHGPAAKLVLGDMQFPLEDLKVSRFTSPEEARDQLRFTATALSLDSSVQVDGQLADLHVPLSSVDLRLAAQHGGGLLTMLPFEWLSGQNARGAIHMYGPFSSVRMEGQVSDCELRLAGIVGRDLRSDIQYQDGVLKLSSARAAVASGHVEGAVEINFIKKRWSGDLRAKHIDPDRLESLLPLATRRFLAGQLDSAFRIGGSIDPRHHPERIRIERATAHLERKRHDKFPRSLDGKFALGYAPERIDLDGVLMLGSRLATSVRGWIDPRYAQTSAEVTVRSRDLTQLLNQLGLPDLAHGFMLRASVRGKLLEPRIQGKVSAQDVGTGSRRLGSVSADVVLDKGRLWIANLLGDGLGGGVSGSAEIGLWNGPFTRPLKEATLRAHFEFKRLGLHLLTGQLAIKGELTGNISVDGPLIHPVGLAEIALANLSLYGDAYREGELLLNLDGRGVEIQHLALERSEGGKLYGSGRIGYDGSLDLHLSPQDLPLIAIPQLRDLPVNVEGTISGKVGIDGRLDRLSINGMLGALAVKVRDILMGDGSLSFVPGGDAIHITGDFFGRFFVDGYLTLAPSLAVHVTISFHELPLDTLVPEIKRIAEAQGTTTGKAYFSYDAATETSHIELRLSQLNLALSSQTEDGGKSVARFSNRGDVVIISDGKSISFKQLRLSSSIGSFEVSGDVSATASNLHMVGKVQLVVFEFFAFDFFAHMHGNARVDVTISGNPHRPHLAGLLELNEAVFEPRGSERSFMVHYGLMTFEAGKVLLKRFDFELDGARLQVQGSMELHNWQPGALALEFSGELAAIFFSWAFPEQVAEATGRVGIDARVHGSWSHPLLNGKLDFRNVSFRSRQLGRDITIAAGTVFLEGTRFIFGCPTNYTFSDNTLCQPLAVRFDASGDLRLDGMVDYAGATLGNLDLHMVGDNLEYGVAGVYSATFSPHVELHGNGKQLRLTGSVALLSGTYSQPFDYQALIIRPRAVESETPFYENIPLLEKLRLDLTVSSTGPISIKNNIANFQVSIPNLRVGGTLSQPTLAGAVWIEEGGMFKIPLLRADFTTDKGSIIFEAGRPFPKETPRFDVGAWSDWSDRFEQIHHIVLKIRGTFRELELDLSSTDGWDKPQVLSALLTGGSPDDLRRQLQSPSGGRAATTGMEGLYQTASGELLGEFFESPLKGVLRFDVIRIELGHVKLCPYNTRYLKLCGSGEGQITPTSRYDVRLEFKLADPLSIVGSAEHIEHGIDTSESIVNRARLQLRFKVPIN